MIWLNLSSTLLPIITMIILILYIKAKSRLTDNVVNNTQEKVAEISTLNQYLQQILKDQQKDQQEIRQNFDAHQMKTLSVIQDSLTKALNTIREQMTSNLKEHTELLNKSLDKLTRETSNQLQQISGKVDEKLKEGFEKTHETFTNVIKRLTIIDEAQKKITELSTNVVSLQEILSDKKSRGAFGEVQLNALIRNMLPEQHFSLQHEFSNQMRVDCLLLLPEPTGNIAIDAKFPMESYQGLFDSHLTSNELIKAKTRFKQDIKKHIKDIAEKYIIPNETADGAVMFIPAEAIFAEIHAHYPDLVEEAQQSRVWLVSPTTMMAILTTARAVLKDAATRKQVHIIQEHLIALSKDFSRFEKRMDKLSQHILQAHEDAEDIHKSSRKITSRFQKIERVDLKNEIKDPLPLEPV